MTVQIAYLTVTKHINMEIPTDSKKTPTTNK